MFTIFYFMWNAFVRFAQFMLVAFNTQCEVYIRISNSIRRQIYGDIEEQPKQIQALPFEEKYLAKYNQLQPREPLSDDEKKALKKLFVMEMTPVGNVAMYYDVDKEAFVYYSDNIMPFRYLETISRKYVCVFNCKELYIERHEVTTEPKKEEIKPMKTKDLIQQKKNVSKPKPPTIEVKMNKYSNSGRFSNFSMLQKVERHVTDKKRLLKFSDFKSKGTNGIQ